MNLDGQVLVDNEDERIRRHHAYRRKILERVVGHLAERRLDRERRQDSPEQDVAIGRGVPDCFRSDDAVAANAVLHHELLPEGVAQALRREARQHIGIAARGIGTNDAHRPLRPLLPVREAGNKKSAGEYANREQTRAEPRE
jgi:hypothetical protein